MDFIRNIKVHMPTKRQSLMSSTSWQAYAKDFRMSPNPATPLDFLLGEIRKSLSAHLYYAALTVALTIPEICGALESETGWGGSDKYRAWYENNVQTAYANLTPKDCYSLRCSILHQGKLGRPGMEYSRVIFTVPNPQNNYYHNNIINDALNLDIITFCNDFVHAAEEWYRVKASDPFVVQTCQTS